MNSKQRRRKLRTLLGRNVLAYDGSGWPFIMEHVERGMSKNTVMGRIVQALPSDPSPSLGQLGGSSVFASREVSPTEQVLIRLGVFPRHTIRRRPT